MAPHIEMSWKRELETERETESVSLTKELKGE